MSKEIVIQASKKETRIAILEEGALAELYVENPENARTIGDIYLGRVRNVMPSIQAAFVNIGQKQDAFLHFSDVGETMVELLGMVGEKPEPTEMDVHVPRVHRSIRASGDYDSSPSRKGQKKKANGKKGEFVHPARYLRNGEKLLVQIVKEPISSKGSRITTHVTLAGRFLVLVPFGDYVAVSKKIWSTRERKRLQAVGRSLLPDGFGLIIRTVAAGKDAKTLHTDMSLLVEKWERIKQKLSSNPSPPKLLHQDVSMVSSVIRDLFTDDYDRILIDDQRLFKSVQTYIRAVAPGMLDAVQYHDSEKPVFEEVDADRAIAEAFSTRVDLPSGGYVIIEHTEAMHVIDVNSGRAGKGESQEENSLKVDLEAASVIAKQLRLRDLGGIIVVDFIDLRDDKNRNKVVNRLKQEFRRDRAVTKVLPMSDFGLIQITRQRLRPSITTDEAAREAEQASAGQVAQARRQREALVAEPVDVSPSAVIERLDSELANLRKAGEVGPVTLTVHPFFAAYLRKGLPNTIHKFRLRHRLRINLVSSEDVSPSSYQIEGKVTAAPKEAAPAPAVAVPETPQERRSSGSSDGGGRAEGDDQRSGSGGSRSGSGGSGSGSGGSRPGSGGSRSGSGGSRSGSGGRSRQGSGGSSGANGSRPKAESTSQTESSEGVESEEASGSGSGGRSRRSSRSGGRGRGRGRGNRGSRQKNEPQPEETSS